MRFRPGSKADKETLGEWARGFADCLLASRCKKDVWDSFVAYCCPHWWLRLYRWLKYSRRRA